MKTARYRAYGSPDNIEIADAPDPTPAAGQLVVKVHATSVNPVDWKIAQGEFPMNLMKPGLPYVPGHDVAGTVEHAAGAFKVGDRVFARIPGRRGGCSAERVAFDASAAAKMPDAMTWNDGAAIPLAGLTALQALRDYAKMPLSGASGLRVLVVGASGGVGHFGVQIAKCAGAHVTGVSSGRNTELVRSLGADAVIDYTKTKTFNEGGDFDIILDCVGGESPSRFTPWLKKGGTFVCCMPGPAVILRQLTSSLGLGARVRAVMMHPDAEGLAWMAGHYEAKRLRVQIDEVFPLDRLADAHRKSIEGRARGKIVVSVTA